MGQLRVLTGYSRRLEQALTCPRAQRRRFLAETRRMAEDFLQGNPKATPEELQAFLGEPGELAQAFLESLPPGEVRRYRELRRNIKLIGTALAIFLVVSSCIISVYILNQPMGLETAETTIIYQLGD